MNSGNERLNWLKSIYPEFEDKDLFYENVYRPSDLKYFDFFIFHKEYKGNINPQNIVGIRYAWAYNFIYEINWYQLFTSLHRLDSVIKNFKSKNDIINHVHYNYEEEKYVLKYGDHYFTTGGQHRLCLAKFLNLESVYVNIKEYKLDKARLIRFKKLNRSIERLSKYKLVTKFEIENFKKISKAEYFCFSQFDSHIKIKIDLLSKFLDYFEKFHVFRPIFRVQIFFNDLLFSKRTNEFPDRIEISEVKDFKKVNSAIILHKTKLYRFNNKSQSF